MILVTGGAYQGKLDFAQKIYAAMEQKAVKDLDDKRALSSKIPKIVDGAEADLSQLMEADIISRFHLYIRHLLKQEKEPWPLIESLLKHNPQVIMTVTELGCGIVPIDAFDRKYREMTGRLCCRLAVESEAVYRVICGIGMKISEETKRKEKQCI
ncbi:bifunctional adenosylcobinamide kinase/adenosylcobinamide-phosphate guanylyltransferase [Lachnospiraceae bacterium ZAX-1]